MDRILVVDSSVQNTDLMSQCLAISGYETITAESGHNAIAKIELFTPHLIIIDAILPDICGFDVCKKVKENPETQFILVLIVSMQETKDSRTRSIQVGADDYMEKTFDAPILISKVKSLLRLKHLSDQLKQKYNELEEKNSILDFQLKMGRQVQRSLIPEVNLSFNNVKFASKYMPAMDIGGDFYDVIQINDHCIAVVMGDVSGHGIAAALLTAMLNMMFKNLVNTYFNPDQLLFYMNNEFYKIFDNTSHEMYACVFYAVIDTNDRKVYYSNAGQSLPIHLSFKNSTATEMESAGLPIGLIKNSKYEYKVLEYGKGDIILFHTDGLSDTFYKDSPEEFSQRLVEILLDAKTMDDESEIIEMLMSSFYKYNTSETEKYELDDVSIILCRM